MVAYDGHGKGDVMVASHTNPGPLTVTSFTFGAPSASEIFDDLQFYCRSRLHTIGLVYVPKRSLESPGRFFVGCKPFENLLFSAVSLYDRERSKT